MTGKSEFLEYYAMITLILDIIFNWIQHKQ